MHVTHKYKIPLSRLYARLELAGFTISPAEKIRVLRLVEQQREAVLKDPEVLKYLLAPVLAHSAADQDRFYRIFDQYMAEMRQDWEPEKIVRAPWYTRVPRWLWQILAVLFTALFTWWAADFLRTVPAPKAYFDVKDHPVGDTLYVKNQSENTDTTANRYIWTLRDAKTTEVEHIDTNIHFTHHIPAVQNGPDKTLELRVEGADFLPQDMQKNFRLLCAEPPPVPTFALPDPADCKVGKELTFTTVAAQDDNVSYHWDFGDGTTAKGTTATHTYAERGSYAIRLMAKKLTNDRSYCESDTLLRIRITKKADSALAYLPLYTLHRDEEHPKAYFTQPWYLLPLLALLAGLYFWWRWWRRPRPEPEEKQVQKDHSARFAAPDKAPYNIPFREQKGLIVNAPQQYRLADVMRRREEGIRQYVDVPTTIKRTIADGGFPQLHFATETRPSDYLLLIDEQAHNSHQARLFQHLAEMLRGQDVYLETYYYHNEFHRFWNADQPNGVSIEQLQRLHPGVRLIIMGDAHTMLDPRAQHQPRLRAEIAKPLKAWKNRLLLSPLPPRSWNWREALLQGLLPVFPSDLDGMLAAAAYMERGMDQEEVTPRFSQWQEDFVKTRGEPDVNYREWRTYAQHKAYFTQYPDLLRWLCAIAVTPVPAWELTIAIGKAIGADISHDNLLLLARIPWLQNGRLHPRLRQELRAHLDPDTERKARIAVEHELAAVAEATAGGFANLELQTTLAVQQFMLAPTDPAHQDTIRFLLDNKILNRRQEYELDQTVPDLPLPAHVEGTKGGQPQDIRAYLKQAELPPILPPRPVFSPDFWRASIATALCLLLLAATFFLNRTDRLYRMAFGVSPEPVTALEGRTDRSTFFVAEDFTADSAIIANNNGVDAYNRLAALPADKQNTNHTFTPKEFDFNTDSINTFADSLYNTPLNHLNRALQLRPDYDTAALNRALLTYNLATLHYHGYLSSDKTSTHNLRLAQNYYRILTSIVPPTLVGATPTPNTPNTPTPNAPSPLHTLHALGLTHFYLHQHNTTDSTHLDSARLYHDTLLYLTDGNYFRSIEPDIYPHLHSLLPAPDSIQRLTGQVTDAQSGKGIAGVRITGNTINTTTDADGNYTIDISKNANTNNYILTYTKDQYESRQVPLRYSQNTIQNILLVPIPVTPPDTPATNTTLPPPTPVALPNWLTGTWQGTGNQYIPEEGTWDIRLTVQENEKNIAVTYPGLCTVTWRPDSITGNSLWVSEQIVSEESGQRCMPDLYIKITSFTDRGNRTTLNCTYYRIGSTAIHARATLAVPPTSVFEKPTVLTGTILDATSRLPIPKVRIQYNDTILTTNAQGQYSFIPPAPQPQAFSLSFSKAGYTDTTVQYNGTVSFLADAQLLMTSIIPDEYTPSATTAATIAAIEKNMVYVQGGSFTMGCKDEKRDGDCWSDGREEPAHDVTLSSYSISKYEVTNAEYCTFLNQNGAGNKEEGGRTWYALDGSSFGNAKPRIKQTKGGFEVESGYENHPVNYVSWYGARAYCAWLSKVSGKSYRLPTEAEWEYAARGGNKSKDYLYSGSDNIDEVTWYDGNSGSNTHSVGSKKANELGIHDMSGNVWEWCADWYGDYSDSPKTNPTGPIDGSYRVERGGSWRYYARNTRVASRNYNTPSYRLFNTGFRICSAAR